MRYFTAIARIARASAALACLAPLLPAQQVGGGNGDVPGHSAFRPGARLLYADDWSTTEVGDIPETIEVAAGTIEIVEEQGRKLLRISEGASFDLVLSGLLPESYTIDFDMLVPSSTGYSVEIRPDIRGSRPGTAGVSRRMQHPVVHCGAIGSGVYGAGSGSVKRFDDRFARAMVPCEIAVTAKGVKVYYAGQLAANVPGAKLGRTNRLRVHIPAHTGEEALIGPIRVAAGVGAPAVASVEAPGAIEPAPADDPGVAPVASSPESAPESEPVPQRVEDPAPEPAPEATPEPTPETASETASRAASTARGARRGIAGLRDLPGRVRRRATEKAEQRADSAAAAADRTLTAGTDRALDAADTLATKTIRAADRVVDCLVTDLGCIRRAKQSGAKIAVTDAKGRAVSSADSARAVARASRTSP